MWFRSVFEKINGNLVGGAYAEEIGCIALFLFHGEHFFVKMSRNFHIQKNHIPVPRYFQKAGQYVTKNSYMEISSLCLAILLAKRGTTEQKKLYVPTGQKRFNTL